MSHTYVMLFLCPNDIALQVLLNLPIPPGDMEQTKPIFSILRPPVALKMK